MCIFQGSGKQIADMGVTTIGMGIYSASQHVHVGVSSVRM